MAEEIQATTIYWGTAQTASTEKPPWYVLPYGAEALADEEGRGNAATTKIKGHSWEVGDRVLLAKSGWSVIVLGQVVGIVDDPQDLEGFKPAGFRVQE